MSKTIENPEELLILISKILDELNIDFYVSGGFAVSVWGRPRFTADIDLIINLEEKNIDQLAKKLKEELPEAYIDKLQMEKALANLGEFNVIEPSIGMKIDFWVLKNDEYGKLSLRRSVKQDIGRKVRFVSPEDLVISKLIWYKKDSSSRHLEDIRSVLDISTVDRKYVKEWVKKFNLEKGYKEI